MHLISLLIFLIISRRELNVETACWPYVNIAQHFQTKSVKTYLRVLACG